jgi:hypothetical protein
MHEHVGVEHEQLGGRVQAGDGCGFALRHMDSCRVEAKAS